MHLQNLLWCIKITFITIILRISDFNKPVNLSIKIVTCLRCVTASKEAKEPTVCG